MQTGMMTGGVVESVAGEAARLPGGEGVRGFAFVRPGEAAEQELRQSHPQRTLIVALDVGKDVHYVYMRTGAGEEVLAPTKIGSMAESYAWVVAQLDREMGSGRYDLVVVGHEPTGVYHEAWSHQLAERYHAHRTGAAQPALRYRQINPPLVKAERQRKSHRRRKTDVRDVSAMAELLSVGVGNPVLRLAEAEVRLRTHLQHLRRLGKRQMRQGIQIRTMLDRLWPGALGDTKAFRQAHPELPVPLRLVESKVLERQTVRVLLEHSPNPYRLRELGAAGIRQLFHAHGARCGPKTAQRIQAVAEQSLLPPPALADVLAGQIQAEFALYRAQEMQVEIGEAQAAALLGQTDAACLISFPGLSETMVARYLAGLVDPARFATARQIWSFAGFDPIQDESGNSRRNGPISYRGCPYLRDTLFQIGALAAKHCPPCQESYARARARHPSKIRATIHVANKANRILFALMRDGVPYSDEYARRACGQA